VLYDHFGSKRGLFLELLERHAASLLEHIASAVAAAEDPESRLRASIEAFFAFVGSEPFAWRIVFRDPATDPEIAARQGAAQDKTTHLIATMFVAGGAPPELLDNVTIVAQLFKSALNGLAAWWWEPRTRPEPPGSDGPPDPLARHRLLPDDLRGEDQPSFD